MMWKPFSIEQLNIEILRGELELTGEVLNFWQRIKIDPVKWEEDGYGQEGNGFWVVGILGSSVIWYNDIEDGFNVSAYITFGKIAEYKCAQSGLDMAVTGLFERIKSGY